MGVFSVLVYLGIGLALLAYFIHDPVPEGCEQNGMVWTTLSMIKLFNYVSRGLGILGFNEPVINRKLMASFSSMSPVVLDPEVSVTNLVFDGVPVRLFRPVSAKGQVRAVVWYHGGGWTFGDADTYHNMLSNTAKDLQAVVLYVEYRLAPEHIFPAAVDDCEAATKYFISHAKDHNVDGNRIAVVGDSAGGTLTPVVTRRLRNQGFTPLPKIQVMIYPVTQGIDFDTPSYRANQNGPFLSRSYMVMYVAAYLFGDKYTQFWNDMIQNRHTTPIIKKSHARTYTNIDYLPKDDTVSNYKPQLEHGDMKIWDEINQKMTDPEFSPLFARDLAGLPPTFVSTCQNDVLRDDGIFFVQHLRDAGVDVTHVNIPSCYHGWIWHRNFSKDYEKQFNRIISYVNDNLH